jgi:predicted anti-sigma-YlaC factor YlaD
MNCKHCEELMSDYLEGTLQQTERVAMDAHLNSCIACKQLLAGIAGVVEWGKTFPVYSVPPAMHARLSSISSVPIVQCAFCEERISDYLEGALAPDDRRVLDFHFESCADCSALLNGMTNVLAWGKTFPVYEPPAWLPSRIVANTPRIEREKWSDTLAAAWRWIIDPRSAIGLFTAVMVMSWLGSVVGVSPNWATVVRNPSAIYYEAQGAVNRAYDEAIRSYYRSPFVNGIKARIEQLREIS